MGDVRALGFVGDVEQEKLAAPTSGGEARDDINRSTGRIRNNQPDRPGGIILRI